MGTSSPLSGALLSIFLPEGLRPGPPPQHALPGALQAARSLQETLSFPSWLSYEGPPPDLATVLEAGVVVVGLSHFWHSQYADSASDPRPGVGGLSQEGEIAVRAIYEAGAIVDVSHLSDAAFDGVAAIAEECGAPLIATHSAARALVGHRRNLTDAQARVIARSGGIIGVPIHAPFLRSAGEATAADWARHVVHLIEVAGPEHVALGSDLDGNIRMPKEIPDAVHLSALAEALGEAGLSDETIARVMGQNAFSFLSSLNRETKKFCR